MYDDVDIEALDEAGKTGSAEALTAQGGSRGGD